MANKIYNLYIKTGKALNIVLTDFTTSASWILIFSMKSVASFVAQEQKKMFGQIKQYSSMAISNIRAKIYPTLSLSEISVAQFVVHEKIYPLLTQSARSFANFIFHERSRVSSVFSQRSSTVFSPILALFIKLSTWDVETLSTLDTKTLEEMDYTVV